MYSLFVLTSLSWRLNFEACSLTALTSPFEVAAPLLVGGELLLGLGDDLGGGLGVGFERFEAGGDGFEKRRNGVDLYVHILEPDQFVECDFHTFSSRSNGPTRIRTWDQPVMSRELYH